MLFRPPSTLWVGIWWVICRASSLSSPLLITPFDTSSLLLPPVLSLPSSPNLILYFFRNAFLLFLPPLPPASFLTSLFFHVPSLFMSFSVYHFPFICNFPLTCTSYLHLLIFPPTATFNFHFPFLSSTYLRASVLQPCFLHWSRTVLRSAASSQ